jgi:UDP-N-acetyl-D-mannosaminuronate dehydrogenase
MPEHAVSLLAKSMGDLKGKKVAVLGISYRGGVKESAFSGVFGTVTALKSRGADVVVHDPMYSDDEIKSLGFKPYAMGANVDAVILQADHNEYLALSASDFPGLLAAVDGRSSLDRSRFAGIRFNVIGASQK